MRDLYEPYAETVDVVMDSDTYAEVDDQYAMSVMLSSPEKFNVRAIFAAPFEGTTPQEGMEKSYAEILHLLDLLNMSERRDMVFRGSRDYLKDETTPQDSDAARRLAELATEYTPERPLYVIAIAAITNIASAILLKPEIADRICVVWLGGHAYSWHTQEEFNLKQDIAAARVVFRSGCRIVHVPCCGVVDHYLTSAPELRYWLEGKNPLCDYLVHYTIEQTEIYAKGTPWSRVIWDVCAVSWFWSQTGYKGRKTLYCRKTKKPLPTYDYSYSFDEDLGDYMYVDAIDRDAIFQLMVDKLTGNDKD